MVNPFLTIAFDLLVIGGTVGLLLAAIAEGRRSRRGVVPARPFRRRTLTPGRSRGVLEPRPLRHRRKLAA
jgi:hypothetical protein